MRRGWQGMRRAEDTPRLNRDHSCSHRQILFYVDRTIDRLCPNGWLVGTIHDINFNIDRTRQRGKAAVLRYGCQTV